MSRIADEGAACAEVLHGLPGGRSEWRCCERRSRRHRWEEGRGALWGRRRDAVAEKRGCGPTEEAEDGDDRAGGLGGDSVGLSLAIRTSAGGASKNDAAGSLDRGGGESVGMKDCAGICPERDIPAETKIDAFGV